MNIRNNLTAKCLRHTLFSFTRKNKRNFPSQTMKMSVDRQHPLYAVISHIQSLASSLQFDARRMLSKSVSGQLKIKQLGQHRTDATLTQMRAPRSPAAPGRPEFGYLPTSCRSRCLAPREATQQPGPLDAAPRQCLNSHLACSRSGRGATSENERYNVCHLLALLPLHGMIHRSRNGSRKDFGSRYVHARVCVQICQIFQRRNPTTLGEGALSSQAISIKV